jgi:DNA-directed RNA polymerase specialized sigma24 family protein
LLDDDTDVTATPDGSPDLDAALLTQLRRLPQRQREVIVFRVFLDLDTRTTAQVLGIAPGTVTAHLSRAVTTLRGHLLPVDNAEVPS